VRQTEKDDIAQLSDRAVVGSRRKTHAWLGIDETVGAASIDAAYELGLRV
jgi:hypothetical protein